jgi:hypothetical protein
MTNERARANNPASGNNAARSADAIRARMAEFCEWFDVEPVNLTVRRGDVYLTDDLMAWFATSGASIDWICCGNVKSMAAAFRKDYVEQRRFLDAFRKFDDTDQKYLLACLKRHLDGGEPMEDVVADFLAFHESRGAAEAARHD